MANDGNNSIGQFRDEIEQTGGEVVKDVRDAVGEMIEQGVQSVKAPQLTPQQVQQKQLEDQKKIAETRRKLKFYQDLAAAQKKIREQDKQKQLQGQQQQQQEQQNEKMEKAQKKQVVMTPPGKRQAGLPLREEVARTRQEIGKGRGIGG